MVFIVSEKKTSLLNSSSGDTSLFYKQVLCMYLNTFCVLPYVTYLIWIQIHAVCVSLWYNDVVNCFN